MGGPRDIGGEAMLSAQEKHLKAQLDAMMEASPVKGEYKLQAAKEPDLVAILNEVESCHKQVTDIEKIADWFEAVMETAAGQLFGEGSMNKAEKGAEECIATRGLLDRVHTSTHGLYNRLGVSHDRFQSLVQRMGKLFERVGVNYDGEVDGPL
jgi:hypothetical protein